MAKVQAIDRLTIKDLTAWELLKRAADLGRASFTHTSTAYRAIAVCVLLIPGTLILFPFWVWLMGRRQWKKTHSALRKTLNQE